jgi:hypothetical protein
MEQCNLLVNAARPTTREFSPVRTFRDSPLGQFRKVGGYFFECHADALREDDECDPSEHGSRIAPVA